MSRVVCAACQEEGRDGCLECGLLPPNGLLTEAMPAPASTPAKPLRYKVLCISFYLDDIEAMDVKVRRLKDLGIGDMSRSRLLRIALRKIDPDVLAAELKAHQ